MTLHLSCVLNGTCQRSCTNQHVPSVKKGPGRGARQGRQQSQSRITGPQSQMRRVYMEAGLRRVFVRACLAGRRAALRHRAPDVHRSRRPAPSRGSTENYNSKAPVITLEAQTLSRARPIGPAQTVAPAQSREPVKRPITNLRASQRTTCAEVWFRCAPVSKLSARARR
jgi:hypothetical protein